MIRRLEEKKKILILLLAVLFFLPAFVNAQQVNISVSAEVKGVAVPPPPTPPGGGVMIVLSANVIFEGRAYPKAFLTLLRNGQVAATFFAENSGLFKKELTGVPPGTYTFGIWAEDAKGRKSATLSFTVGILSERTTTISGIFIPPTIEVGPTQVEKGEVVDISGQVFPESEINIFISPKDIVKQTKVFSQGEWLYKLDTSILEEQEYFIRAKAFYGDGEQSAFSQTVSFLVLPSCRGADLNLDGKVDLVDFSILLYFWGQKNPANRCADINSDGTVNIIDFSIMMYWWNG